jgi:PAS domain S-box-containing protein
MENPLKILLLEDSQLDAEIIRRLLIKGVSNCEFKLAINKKTFLSALDEFMPDVILSDNSLPRFNAVEALKIVRERSLRVPFILITGTVSEEYAAGIIKQGADDYVLKDRLTRLPAAIDSALRYRQAEKEKLLATEKLIQSEVKYRTIFLKSPLPKWIYDIETLRFLDVNEAAILQYGYSGEEFLKMTIKDIRPREDVNDLLDDISKIQADSHTRQGNWKHRKKNGEIIIVQTTAHAIDYNGRKVRMVVANDVTEKIIAEQQKEFDSNNLKALINNTKDLMWSVDRDLKLITFNDAFNKVITFMSGKSLEKGKDILSTQFTEQERQRYKLLYERALTGESFTIIDHFVASVEVWAEISFYPIHHGDKIVGTACFSRDITERKKAEADLHRMEQEKLENKIEEQKKMTRAMLIGQERERNAIGRELHDNVNQILVATNMTLSLAKSIPPNVQELIASSINYVQEAIKENRKIAHVFVAPDLKTENLAAQIEKLSADMLGASNIAVSLNTELFNESLLDTERKFNIYRIAQEQCTNIVKYAKATAVTIILITTVNSFAMSVADDGIGMDAGKKVAGIGIRNIKDRVSLFNGTVNIITSPGEGFRLEIMIPL